MEAVHVIPMIRLFGAAFLLIFLTGQLVWADETEKDASVRREAASQVPVSQPPIDLKSAVSKALENNPGVRQARVRLEQDSYDMKATRALIFPNLNLIGTGGRYKNSILNSTATRLGGDTPHDQYDVDLRLSQPLFAYGSLAAIRSADDTSKMNQLDLEIAERTLTNNVIQYFYKVMLNKSLLEILEKTQAVVNESLSTAQSRMRTGRGQLLDVLQVKTQMALLKPQIEDAHNQLESAGAQLATLMSEPGKYELQPKGTLKGILLKDLQRKIDFKSARLPELERIRIQREQLGELRDVSYGKHMPNLFLNGDYGYANYNRDDLFRDASNGWSIYLQLTIPLFSGFESIYEQRSFSAQDRELEYQSRDVSNTLSLTQVQTLKSLESTGASLVSAEEAAHLADQSMAEARRNYRLATIDFLQFLTVQQSMLQADSSLNNIRYQNLVALANYFVAVGQPLSSLVDFLQEKN